MKTFRLPDLGEGLAEAEIIAWHVDEGDSVETDQVLLTVETAKALVEVPAPYQGRILHRYGKVGDILHIGVKLVDIEPSTAASSDAGTVVGQVSQHTATVNVEAEQPIGLAVTHSELVDNVVAMPSARRLARKLGIDLHRTPGSGPNGTVLDSDVYNQCQHQLPGTEVLKGARRSMAKAMAESHHHVASVTLTEEAILAEAHHHDITVAVIKAMVHACQTEPALNAWFDEETMTRCMHDNVSIGIAVDSEHGLYVPVIKSVDSMNDAAIRGWLRETVKGIRSRRLGHDQGQTATLTLSNFGAIAGLYATPVITPPQVAIIGIGRLHEQLALDEQRSLVTQHCLPISMTFDHRACTGGEAARFMRALTHYLQGE
ncbi:dihydrolipoamide acetyltransferase family protein [Thaumasiovibrio subtropicus]|uniref:dihydrolipoamide acetyltransferase family protein n=1 Tax=Thaumasiovibrio subtropicus TaxID=1891207 RepID=UPI000B3616DF|nr:dihydrolipoamide acetyltransferase family protein [Thaumasiovibrio subtropicus]